MRFTKLSLILVAAGSLHAQHGPDVVTRQLAMAILRFQNVSSYGYFGQGQGEPVLSEHLPPTLSTTVPTPPTGEVLGAVIWARMTDVFGVADGNIESARAWFADEFSRRHYTVTNDEMQTARFGGFRDPQVGPVSRGGGYCAGPDLVNLDLLPLDQRRVQYRVRVSGNHQNCRDNVPTGRRASFIDPAELPTLFNPANTSMNVGMWNFGGCDERIGGSGISALLSTKMSPGDIMKHYEKQMMAAGWKQVPVPAAATSTWSKLDGGGNETILVLTASAGRKAPDCRFVEMTVSRPPSRNK